MNQLKQTYTIGEEDGWWFPTTGLILLGQTGIPYKDFPQGRCYWINDEWKDNLL